MITLLLSAVLLASSSHAQVTTCPMAVPNQIDCSALPMPDSMRRAPVSQQEGQNSCGELANCICGLIGNGSCGSLEESLRALQHRTAPRFGRSQAQEANQMVVDSRNNDVNDDVSLFTLPYHSRVASEFAAFILQSSTQFNNIESIMDSVIMCHRLRGAVGNHEFRGAQMPAGEASEAEWKAALQRWTQQLLCTFRQGGFERQPLLEYWPSECPCGSDSRGIQLTANGAATFCMESERDPDHPEKTPADDFARAPIDAQMPGKFKDTVKKLLSRLPRGYSVSRIELNGCTMLRMKTTKDMVRRTREGVELKKTDVSDHGRATACDVTSIEVTCPRGAQCPGGKRSWNMVGPEKARPFKNELQTFMRAEVDTNFDYSSYTQIRSPEQDQIYCNIESYITQHPDGGGLVGTGRGKMSAEDWEQFKLGIFAQRSFREAGLTVESPFTNEEHFTHYHVELAVKGPNTPAACEDRHYGSHGRHSHN